MKQNPSRLKFKKYHKPSSFLLYSKEQKNFYSKKVQLVLRSLQNGKLIYNKIEACRKSIRRMLNKKGSIILRLFTNAPLTKKSIGSRMGKGKGSHNMWVCPIRKGQIICEVICDLKGKYDLCYKALAVAAIKLPVRSIVCINNY